MQLSKLKARLLELLKEDLEFRYAVAGLLGLEEVLRRLDGHGAEMVRLREDFNRKAEEDSKRFAAIEAELVKLREDLNRLREDMNKLREDFNRKAEEDSKRFAAIEAELVRLREDMVAGFRRHDEEIAKVWGELASLRQDMVEGLGLLRRHIDALGARWGMLSERAFREGLRGVVEKALGLKVERWIRSDDEGYVYGHPSEVDVDVAIHDGKTILIEVKSHVSTPDVLLFKRKAEFYERTEGRRPDRLLMVTPYADEDALKAAEQLQVEVYTGV